MTEEPRDKSRNADIVRISRRDRADAPATARSLYSELGHSTLVEFGEPYRAQAFVGRLNERAPTAQLDWFRKGVGRFAVILRYDGEEEFKRVASELRRAGFPVR